MERLTYRLKTGEVLMATEYEEKYTKDEWIVMLQCRLAAYEDTGLTPEEINDLASVREISPEAEYAINKHADNIIERLDTRRTTMLACASWRKPTRTVGWWCCHVNQESMYLHCLMAKSVCGSVRSNTRFWTVGEKFSILCQSAVWETRIARHLGRLARPYS